MSSGDLRALERRRLLRAGTGHHIPNAVDATKYTPGDKTAARAAASLPPDGLVIGTVARLVPQKGVDVLIDSMRDLPAVTLVIIGDGPLRPELEQRAETLGARVRFLGMRDDVAALLPALDVFVLPSRWEGEPMALLQAMACGLPCIATGTSGSSELLAGGRGVITRIDDSGGIAAAVRTLSDDPKQRLRLGQAARRFAEGRSWLTAATRVVELYEGLDNPQPMDGEAGTVDPVRASK